MLFENCSVLSNRYAESPSFSSYFRFRKPSTPVLSVDPLILSPLEDVSVSNGPHSPIFPLVYVVGIFYLDDELSHGLSHQSSTKRNWI